MQWINSRNGERKRVIYTPGIAECHVNAAPKQKWSAEVFFCGTTYHLGTFASPGYAKDACEAKLNDLINIRSSEG
jgi:hypothetical protein